MTPRQLSSLRRCSLLFRFDFQAGLEAKLERLKRDGLKVVSIRAPEGLCLPLSYLATCRDIADALGKENPPCAADYAHRVEEIERRMEQLTGTVAARLSASDLVGVRVISSRHQDAFCRWLGLNVVATLLSPETESIGGLREALEAGRTHKAQLIVSTLQEGPQQATRLAEALGIPVVTFSNFPAMTAGENTFDDLVGHNVGALLRSRPK